MQPSGFTLVAFYRVCNNSGSVIPHTLHTVHLRCFNGKQAIAAIPSETVLEHKWVEDI